MTEQIVYTGILNGYRSRSFLLFLLTLFAAFVVGESAGYSQCAVLPPVPPTNLFVTTTITAPTITQNVSQVSAGTGLVTYCFSGGSLSADWFNRSWSTGGSALVSGGLVTVDGALIGLNNLSSVGSSVDFVAIFSGDPWQHVGFGVDLAAAPWAIFSTGGVGGSLYARTNNGTAFIDTPIPGNWLGSSHRYHIDWSASSVVFSIDGNVVATHSISIGASMRPVASDYLAGGSAAVVQSLQISSSSASGTATSFDFSVSNSGDQSVTLGSSLTNSISSALLSGASQPVSFSASGVPSGATASFSSASCTPNCSTVLTISTAASTPVGSFPITVTAAAGGVTRTTVFTSAVVSTGKIYYVATNGSDSNSCAQAQNISTPKQHLNGTSGGLSCLKAGDVLDIRGGTYNEKIQEYIPYPLAFAPLGNGFGGGTSWTNAITIQGHAGETVTIGGVVFDGNSPNTMQYLIFSNLVIDSSLTGSEGVYAGVPAHHLRFQNVEMKNGGYHGFSGACAFCEVLGGSIHDNQGYGIYHWGHDTLFDRIEVYNNKGFGYHIYSCCGDVVSNNIVRFGKIHDNGGDCIKCVQQGVSPTAAGIIISSGPGNQVYDNLVYDNAKGIVVDYACNNCLVFNNTVFRNNRVGSVSGPQPAAGIQLAPGTPSILSGAVIQNNIVYNNPVNGIYVNSSHVSGAIVDHNLCDSAAAGCSVTGDPSFADTATNNFALKAGSPAIDTGVAPTITNSDPSQKWSYDVNGISRPLGKGWDIGAYESW